MDSTTVTKSQMIKKALLMSYEGALSKAKLEPNKALRRYLEEPEEKPSKDGSITFVFRGNYKLNFGSRLKDNDIIMLVNVLKMQASNLRHLDLSYNEIKDLGAKSLSDLLGNCPNLETLNLQGNSIGKKGAQDLGAAMKGMVGLRYLNLNWNKIETEGAMALVENLFNNTTLEEFNVSNNEINHDGIIGITSVLNSNDTLRVLNCENPTYTSIGQDTAIHFSKMLEVNRGLEKLSLAKHAFTCPAIYTITEHLLRNDKLRVLDLTANRISFKGCEALKKYLTQENCRLESLILASNRTGHFGAKAISAAISGNRTLVHLDMTRNDIDDEGLRMLAESLAESQTLVSVKLYWNHFGQESLKVFHKLQTNKEKYRGESDWFFDFYTYVVDDHIEMAYLDTEIPYDVQVTTPYAI